jgi:hypothetical protein
MGLIYNTVKAETEQKHKLFEDKETTKKKKNEH